MRRSKLTEKQLAEKEQLKQIVTQYKKHPEKYYSDYKGMIISKNIERQYLMTYAKVDLINRYITIKMYFQLRRQFKKMGWLK